MPTTPAADPIAARLAAARLALALPPRPTALRRPDGTIDAIALRAAAEHRMRDDAMAGLRPSAGSGWDRLRAAARLVRIENGLGDAPAV